MSINTRKFIVEFNNKLKNSKNPFLNENEHFKMVKGRGGYEKGPLPTIKDFTDYSRPWEINLYWTDKAKSLNIVKKHIYDILRNYIGYSEEITQKAMEEADIHKMELPEEHKKFFSKLPTDWEVIIKSDIEYQR